MSEQYRKEIGRRTRRGLEGLARQGTLNWIHNFNRHCIEASDWIVVLLGKPWVFRSNDRVERVIGADETVFAGLMCRFADRPPPSIARSKCRLWAR